MACLYPQWLEPQLKTEIIWMPFIHMLLLPWEHSWAGLWNPQHGLSMGPRLPPAWRLGRPGRDPKRQNESQAETVSLETTSHHPATFCVLDVGTQSGPPSGEGIRRHPLKGGGSRNLQTYFKSLTLPFTLFYFPLELDHSLTYSVSISLCVSCPFLSKCQLLTYLDRYPIPLLITMPDG